MHPSSQRVSGSGISFFLLFLLFICSFSRADEPPDLDRLLERIRVEPPARVAFTEQRQNRLLKEPMVLGGYLAYPAPGRLEKVIETPFRETLRVDGDEVSITRDGAERRISLRNRASFRVMLASIEAVMAGGGDTLREHFDATVYGDDADWRIELQPRGGRLARQLEKMEVTGGAAVESIRFELADGEWQRLEIHGDEPADG